MPLMQCCAVLSGFDLFFLKRFISASLFLLFMCKLPASDFSTTSQQQTTPLSVKCGCCELCDEHITKVQTLHKSVKILFYA